MKVLEGADWVEAPAAAAAAAALLSARGPAAAGRRCRRCYGGGASRGVAGGAGWVPLYICRPA